MHEYKTRQNIKEVTQDFGRSSTNGEKKKAKGWQCQAEANYKRIAVHQVTI